jgi:hypothetical protein
MVEKTVETKLRIDRTNFWDWINKIVGTNFNLDQTNFCVMVDIYAIIRAMIV